MTRVNMFREITDPLLLFFTTCRMVLQPTRRYKLPLEKILVTGEISYHIT